MKSNSLISRIISFLFKKSDDELDYWSWFLKNIFLFMMIMIIEIWCIGMIFIILEIIR